MSGKSLEAKNVLESDEIREWLDWLLQEVSESREKEKQIEGRNLYEELKNFNFEQILEQSPWKDKWFKRIKPWLEKSDNFWKYIEINGEKYYNTSEILSWSNIKNKKGKILTYRISDGYYGTVVQLHEINEKYQSCGTSLVYNAIDWHITSIKNYY